MNYKINAKSRRLKRTWIKFLNIIKFEWLNINTHKKIIIVWSFISIYSLFLNWIWSNDNWFLWSSNIFHKLLWISWITLLIFYLIILFIILSKDKKETLKKVLKLNINDWIMIFVLWLFNIYITINNLFIIINLNILKSWIFFENWVIVSIVGNIFILLWALLMVIEKTNLTVYSNEYSLEHLIDEPQVDLKNNMKLPF